MALDDNGLVVWNHTNTTDPLPIAILFNSTPPIIYNDNFYYDHTLYWPLFNQTAFNYDYNPNDFNLSIHLPYMNNVTFLLNISRDIPEKLSLILFGNILPNLFVLTIITNLLIVAVLAQSHMRTPTNLVLLVMAIADLLTLLIPLPWYLYLFTFGHHHESIYPVSLCYIFHLMYEVLPALFHTYSIWLTLFLAAQRYIYVCHFSLARRWCTVPQVIRAILIILTIAILHQSTRFFDRIFLPVEYILENGKISNGCEYYTSDWVIHYVGEDLYYIIYYGFRIIFVHTGPCILLVWLNVALFTALHRTQKTRKRLLSGINNNALMNNNRINSTATAAIIQSTDAGIVNTVPLSLDQQHFYNHNNFNSNLHHRSSLSELNIVNQNNNNNNNNNNNDADDDGDLIITENNPNEFIINFADDLDQTMFNGELMTAANSLSEPIKTIQSKQDQQCNNKYRNDRPLSTSYHNHLQSTKSTVSISMQHHRLDSRSTTVMLIVIVTMFLFLEIPLALTTILHVVQNTFALELVNYSVLNTIIMMANFFIIVSYPINFAIYCGMSKQFRVTFHQSILVPMCKYFNCARNIPNYGRHYLFSNNNKANNNLNKTCTNVVMDDEDEEPNDNDADECEQHSIKRDGNKILLNSQNTMNANQREDKTVTISCSNENNHNNINNKNIVQNGNNKNAISNINLICLDQNTTNTCLNTNNNNNNNNGQINSEFSDMKTDRMILQPSLTMEKNLINESQILDNANYDNVGDKITDEYRITARSSLMITSNTPTTTTAPIINHQQHQHHKFLLETHL